MVACSWPVPLTTQRGFLVVERSVKVRLQGDVSDFNRAMLGASAGAKAFVKDLDTSSDRMANLVQTSLALGPALVPIGAAAIPAIAGLTNQLAFAAVGAGVTALAFSGIGDALSAVNDYSLEPTAANFAKMQDAMALLGPSAQEFVGFLQELRPELQQLQEVAAEGLLPGVQEGLTEFTTLLPQVERIVSEVASSLGDLAAEAGTNLAGPEWEEFFTFLETEARPTLMAMGRSLGNFAEGFANLWMAFDPLSDNFSQSFLEMSRDFAEWTDQLGQTDGFNDFVDYINRVGPKAWDTLGSLGNALLQLVEAAAPVGEVSLPVIKALADALSLILDSPAGPVLIGAAAGISAISRAVALYNMANGSALSGFLGGLGGKGAGARAAAAGVGILALSLTDLDEKAGLSKTATFALMGAVAGPWGAAIGGAAGLTMDFANANDDLWQAVDRAQSALSDGSSTYDQQATAVEAARVKVEDLRTSTEKWYSGLTVKGQKDHWEGVFGTSDMEEAEQALSSLNLQMAITGPASAVAAGQRSVAEAMQVSTESAAATADSFIDIGAAVDVAEGSLSEFRQQTLDQAQALSEFTANAIEAAHRGVDQGLIAKLKELGPAGAEILAQLANASESEIGRQNAAFQSGVAAIRDYIALTGEIPQSVYTEFATPGAPDAIATAARLGNQYGMTPTQLETTMRALDYATPDIKKAQALMAVLDGITADPTIKAQDKASAIAKAIQRYINGMQGKTVTITTIRRTINEVSNRVKKTFGFADGGIVDYFADGGMRENHVAEIAPAGAWRVWAEPETGGESYIPLAPEKRARSLDIWAETGKRLGVQGFANGGVVGGRAEPQVMSFDLTGLEIGFDSKGLARIVAGEARAVIASDKRDNLRTFNTISKRG